MFNINLHQLIVINAIEKEGSMTRAAEKLYISQSALSHHVQELEKKIGAKVFERRSKKLHLTPIGRKMINSAAVVLAELQKLEQEIQLLKTCESGTINISTECYTTYNWLPRLIRKFNEVYPHVTVQIMDGATRDPLRYLQSGTLDIALVSRLAKQQLNDNPSFKYTPVFQDELVVVISKENPLSKHRLIYPKDFREQSLIIYDIEEKYNDLIQDVLKPNEAEPARVIKMPLTEVIIEMVKSNLGIAVMAKWIIAPLLNNDMKILPFRDDFSKRSWCLVTLPDQNSLQKDFIAFAVKELQNIM
jgi:LysR family transcriptional regulator for metE and metH